MADASDFDAVSRSDAIQAVVARHKLAQPKILHRGGYRGALLRHDLMTISKDSWTIILPAMGIDGINVHFESRGPGVIRIDIEPYPYEAGVGKNPKRCKELERHIKLKSELITLLRAAVDADSTYRKDFGATTAHLKDADDPSALGALKFKSTIGDDAQFFARIIDRLAPVIDKLIANARRQITS